MLLQPYRVLDLTDHGAMIAGQMLGDLGADVILVEPPGGAELRRIGPWYHDERDPNRSLTFWSFNRNKRSIVLDLANSEADRETFRRLAATADIVLESFAPGTMDAWGLGYASLAQLNPRLVYVAITPYGSTGPKSGWPAADLAALAASGVLLITGDDDRPPVALAVPQAMLHAGADAAAAALVALFGAVRDGVGQFVDVSAQTSAMAATQATILAHGLGEVETQRLAGGVRFGPFPLKFVHPAADGYVSVTFLFGTAMGPFSRRLMEVMYEEGIVDEATRDKDWIGYTNLLLSGQEPISELIRCNALISEFTKRHTKAELLKLAFERGLLIVPVSTMADLAHSEQLAARDYWTEVEHPELGATVRYHGPWARFSRTPMETRRRPPLLGEHTAAVRAEVERAPVAAVAGPPRLAELRPPLEGVKVLDFMWVVAGPWATRALADYGATVVRVESTTRVDTVRTIGPFKDRQPGPERTGAHHTVNANKYTMTLNLLHPKGRELALRLVQWADVVCESFTPGAMAKLGLSYEDLRKVKPDIIMMSSCLNGQTGPYATLAGYGTMGAQLAGFGELAGWPDRPPAGPAGAYTDYVVPKFEVAALLAALDHRRRTGEGQYIDFSQAEAAIHFLGPALLDYLVNGRLWQRQGNASPWYAPHGVYPAAGTDRWVAIACLNDAQWQALCRVIGREDWAADPQLAAVEGRIARRSELDEGLAAWTAARDPEEIERLLNAAGIPAHRAASSADAFSDPQLAHRGHFVTVTHPELGPIPVENARWLLSRTPPSVRWPGGTFGQHNDLVLRDILGLSEEEIVAYVASGALE